MKIAIFNNFMDNIGGAEIATLTLARGLKADIYTTNISADKIIKMGFEDVLPRIYSIGKIPIKAPFRHQLAFWKFRRLNLGKKYNFYIISGDWAMSAAVNHHPNIWYVYSPLNELWEFKDYVKTTILSKWKRPLFEIWVSLNRFLTKKYARSVDKFIAISKNTQERIKKYYQKDTPIIYPPTECAKYHHEKSKNYWLSVNRIVVHKRIEIQIEAFRKMPSQKLIIVGSYEKGADQFETYKRSIEKDLPKNIEIINWANDTHLKKLYSECKGFITTAHNEDFGMTAVEAMASGKPIIAPNEGGYKESVINNINGILIDNINSKKLISAVAEINEQLFKNPDIFRDKNIKQAQNFSTEKFIAEIKKVINS